MLHAMDRCSANFACYGRTYMSVPRDHYLFMTDVSSTRPLVYHVIFYEWSDGVTYTPILLGVSFGFIESPDVSLRDQWIACVRKHDSFEEFPYETLMGS